jgi:hypothetical protein
MTPTPETIKEIAEDIAAELESHSESLGGITPDQAETIISKILERELIAAPPAPEPLPDTDPLAHIRKAVEAGIPTQFFNTIAGNQWQDNTAKQWKPTLDDQPHLRWRIKPQTKEVPLEASDIVPGCVVAGKNCEKKSNWLAIIYVSPFGVVFGKSDVTPFTELQKDFLIRYPGESKWKPCSKTVEVE